MLEQEINKIRKVMKDHKISKKDLAEAMGKNRLVIIQALNIKGLETGLKRVKQGLKEHYGIEVE